jgi:hypothetical protein
MYATIQNRKVELLDGIPDLATMQAAVGGLIETALRIPTGRKDITVNVYCNEEGLLMGLPIYFKRGTDGSYLAGDFVIVGGDESNGETVGLTLEEIGLTFDHLTQLAEPITDYEI